MKSRAAVAFGPGQPLKIVEIEDFKMDYPLNMVHKEGSDFQNVPQDVIRYFEKVVKETFC